MSPTHNTRDTRAVVLSESRSSCTVVVYAGTTTQSIGGNRRLVIRGARDGRRSSLLPGRGRCTSVGHGYLVSISLSLSLSYTLTLSLNLSLSHTLNRRGWTPVGCLTHSLAPRYHLRRRVVRVRMCACVSGQCVDIKSRACVCETRFPRWCVRERRLYSL